MRCDTCKPRCGEQALPDGHHYTTHAARLAGLTYRQLEYWRTAQYVAPAQPSHGSGSWAAWSPDDIARLTRVAARLHWGLTVEAALRDDDPGPVPPPLHEEVA